MEFVARTSSVELRTLAWGLGLGLGLGLETGGSMGGSRRGFLGLRLLRRRFEPGASASVVATSAVVTAGAGVTVALRDAREGAPGGALAAAAAAL